MIFQKPKLGHPVSQRQIVKNQKKIGQLSFSYISLIQPIFIKFWDDHFHLWLSWYGMTLSCKNFHHHAEKKSSFLKILPLLTKWQANWKKMSQHFDRATKLVAIVLYFKYHYVKIYNLIYITKFWIWKMKINRSI